VVYSNPNYLVLGVIVARITGEELTSTIRREVFDPLRMNNTAHASAELRGSTREALPVIPRHESAPLLEDMKLGGYDRDDAVAQVTDGLVYLNAIDILPCWGGVKGTAADATRFGQLFVDQGVAPGGRVLEGSTVREMMTPQKSNDGEPQIFGIGWKVGIGGRPAYVEHAGGGPGIDSLLRVYPKEDVVIAVLGNVVGYGSGRLLEYTFGLVE
jgi:CubicO group peptidase (beta-lactamase class C family)